MKKIIVFFLLIVLLLSYLPNKPIEEVRGVYFSYIEISKYLKDKEESSSKKQIDEILDNLKNNSLNTIILQVRPSCDAIYQSSIFPYSKYLTDTNTYPYDVLSYFLEESHKRNIKLYAWINPYRVSTTGCISDLEKNSPVYKYIGTDILWEENGVYLNPARDETKNLIEEGVKEILNYPVDGILFDDYFYPSEDIDEIEWKERLKKEDITKEEFHLEMVNEMIKSIHELCKKKNVLFGVSPEGNIENNYEKNYADVKRWLKEENYIDFIMPQLYYGFENEKKPFYETSNEWSNLIENKVDLYPVLAFYKVGKKDFFAASGEEEWINNSNIIQREIIHSRSLKHYKGFILYRYDYLFLEEEFTDTSKDEIKNVKKIIN